MSNRYESRIRFSLASVLSALAAFSLLSLVVRQRMDLQKAEDRLAKLQLELEQSRPIPFSEVKTQFERILNERSSIVVESLHYHSKLDAYSISFGWPDSGKMMGCTILLRGENDGSYTADLHFAPFARTEGTRNIPMSVAIKSRWQLKD